MTASSSGDALLPLRLALEQFRPEKGRPEANLARIRERLLDHRGVTDLVVFPEAALAGAFLEGGVREAARTAAEVALGLGAAPADAPDVVVGFHERWRHGVYNAVGYFAAGPDGGYRPVRVHRKLFLSRQGVFDEARFLDAGRAVRPVDTRFGRIGLLVGDDLRHGLPPTVLALAGAELLVVVAASPARDFQASGAGAPANLARWDRVATAAAEEHGIFVAVAQLVGSEGGKLLSGGALVVGPEGDVLARGPFLDEGVVRADLERGAIERARSTAPLLADLERMLPHLEASLARASRGRRARRGGGPERERAPLAAPSPTLAALAAALELDLGLVERALTHFIREEVRRRGFERVVIGVSGGVDSAVSLYLACRALGPDKVHGLRLPHATSSADSLAHAALVLGATGAHAQTIEITGPVDAYVDAHAPAMGGQRRGNVMARVRAAVLFDQSAAVGALPLGTSNKSERLLGYYTWHAEDTPPINPLGDLFKTQVWALARHLGVPDEIVTKPASADLVQGVHDADELGIGYREADPILHGLTSGYTPEALVRGGFDEASVALVHRWLSGTHWKRELPTVAMLSSSAIGAFYLRPVDY